MKYTSQGIMVDESLQHARDTVEIIDYMAQKIAKSRRRGRIEGVVCSALFFIPLVYLLVQ